MRVVEKFISINGEGRRAGELAVFIRFHGCNLNCSYCDTQWANQKDCPYTEESPQDIYHYILSTGIKNVTLTGGEPLIHQGMINLITILCADERLRVEVETNGSVNLKMYTSHGRPTFTMDYKLPSSFCEHKMLTSNFSVINENDTVKFVCGSRQDLDRALEIIEQYHLLEKCKVYFSPVFGSIDPVEIVEFMMEHKLNDARLQIQMHKVIWDPEKRGV